MNKLAVLKQIWGYLRSSKKWWLTPILVMLFLLSALIILSQGSALAPFIYTIF